MVAASINFTQFRTDCISWRTRHHSKAKGSIQDVADLLSLMKISSNEQNVSDREQPGRCR